MTKDTTEKVLESHRGEILQTTEKTKMCGGGYSKLSFFKYEDQFGHVRKVSSDFLRYFQFPKFRHIKEYAKKLEPQVNPCNMCSVHHH